MGATLAADRGGGRGFVGNFYAAWAPFAFV
jgi:hypothetical protein